ncbi:hypothetical protein C6497_17530 [Candidatus Poribacteria bacterium]|nr:MAG: hypothetical protein C6497_17530 [Candidatus Poribacteria bacterium]
MRYNSMTHSKLSIFLIILPLITTVTFVAGVKAQDTENNNTPLQEFINKAKELMDSNQLEEAIEIYERIVIAAPDDDELRLKLATLYTRINQHEKAAQIYSQLLEDDPDNIKYQDERFKSLQAAGKHNEALEIVQVYIQMYPEAGVHYAQLARLYDAEGNDTSAIENYKKATVFEYGDKEIYLRLAEYYFLNEDIAAAEEALKNAISYATEWDKEVIERQLLNLYRYQGNFEEMLQKFETEGTLTLEMQTQRARYFQNAGYLEKAAVHFKKAIEMTNSSYERNDISNELLNLYSKQGREDLALAFYEAEAERNNISKDISRTYSSSGITIQFGDDDIRRTLINVYKNQEKINVLETLFEGKLEKDVDNPTVLEMLAEIYWESNNYQKAAEAYHTLGNTKSMGRRNIRSYFHAAAAFHKNNQPDMVKTVLNQANTALSSTNYKQDASFLGALATICLNNKMYDQALELAEDAVSQAKDWKEYLYEILAKSYLGEKRYEDAFEAYQQMAMTDRSYHKDRAERGMNDAAKAGNLYEKWIPEQLKKVQENPYDPKYVLELAKSYEATDNTKEAVAQYERLTELEEEKAQWYRKLGTLYQNLPQENSNTDTVSEESNTEHSKKSINAYEKAIELEPTSYQLYDLLAQTYIKTTQTPQAEATYRSALNAPLTQSNYDAAIRAILQLYADDGQEDKRISILEELKPKMDKSAVLLELLGDLYKKVGDSKKAELNYSQWLQIRQKELNSTKSISYYRSFADKLLDKGLFPETALFYAKRAFIKNTYSGYDYLTTLGGACVANGLYDEALRHFKNALSLILDEYYTDMLWKEIAETIKYVNDKERYIQMLETLIDSMPSHRTNARANIYHVIADFYAENETPEYVENYLINTGFIPETAWITLGPFDNKDSVGLLTAYIPEETTQIDTTAMYYGKDKPIRWKKPDDGKRNGMIWLGSDIDWTASYAWTIVSSPDERDITIRFDSDDQGIIWLNGSKVFSHNRMGGAQIDRYTVPITLKQGDNTILVKVCNATIHTCFFMRLTDIHGTPFKDLKFIKADELLNTPAPKQTFHVNVNLGLAEYYHKNNMYDKAMEQMQQTGTLHENLWMTLGPFDNIAGIGYNTEYIPDDTTQIDPIAKYDGIDEKISWKKFTDTAFDGFIDFGEDINWRVAYAWTTISSPDEREVLFRFGSDDQSKIWLNSTEVFADTRAQTALLDKNTIPVTLKKGENTILVKVCNEEMSWGFYLRITDTDGNPFKDLIFNDTQD